MTSADLSVAFFLQMFFILAACRAVGWVARRCGQPQVIGEMVAGVLIGPSLLGLFWPGAQPALFSIMVLMAIVTTLMASPLFEWVYGKRARAAGELDALSSKA